MTSPHKGATGLQRIINATRYSLAGLGEAVRREQAFQQELLLTAVLVPVALRLGDTGIERALLIASLVLVLIVELINSAIEATQDRISLEQHPLAKHAKDFGSAAVMLALINAALVWLLVLFG
ncbi:MAG TPA: diacylglycerol kinase [Burkholderiales bacterium]|nr:diacylglycerol kinase [Burkholderiales bacterium]